MKRRGVCLILTDRCNAECEICCFSCSPENKNVMDEDLMFETIRQAAELGTVQQIGFSGGEPFLYYDLLKKGLMYAKKLGFYTSVATNGFWGAWPDEMLEEKIKVLPIDQMSFSYDAYHGKYIKEEQFVRAMSICKILDINVTVGIGETKGEGSANRFFKKMGDNKYLMNYYIYPFMPCGRAEGIPDEQFFKYRKGTELFCRDEETLAVRYDGEVFPCCTQTVFSTCLSLGNIKNASVKELIKNSRMAQTHEVMLNPRAFTELGRIAREELGMDLPDMCVSPCEICQKLFQEDENFTRLYPYIDKLYKQMLTKAFLGSKGV